MILHRESTQLGLDNMLLTHNSAYFIQTFITFISFCASYFVLQTVYLPTKSLQSARKASVLHRQMRQLYKQSGRYTIIRYGIYGCFTSGSFLVLESLTTIALRVGNQLPLQIGTDNYFQKETIEKR